MLTEGRPCLYFAPGTCARVPLIALEEIGAPFETRLVAFMAGEHRLPEFLVLNPSGKVPALVTGEVVISQNSAILWYLARSFPAAGLLPTATCPADEARLFSHLSRFAADLHPLVTRIVLPRFFATDPDAQQQVRHIAEEAMRFQLASLESTLAGQPWYLGQSWSILDAYLGWVWFRITGAGFPDDSFPSIRNHYARLLERPATERALAREAQAQDELEARGLALPGVNNR